MKNKILKIVVLVLSGILLFCAFIFDDAKDRQLRNDIYDDSSGLRLPINMASVHTLMPQVPTVFYVSLYYGDDEKDVYDDVYHNEEKVAELFELIESKTWYYVDEEDRSIVCSITCNGQIIQNGTRESFTVRVYANCITIAYKDFNDEYQYVRSAATKDGYNQVLEKMLEIVDDSIQNGAIVT